MASRKLPSYSTRSRVGRRFHCEFKERLCILGPEHFQSPTKLPYCTPKSSPIKDHRSVITTRFCMPLSRVICFGNCPRAPSCDLQYALSSTSLEDLHPRVGENHKMAIAVPAPYPGATWQVSYETRAVATRDDAGR